MRLGKRSPPPHFPWWWLWWKWWWQGRLRWWQLWYVLTTWHSEQVETWKPGSQTDQDWGRIVNIIILSITDPHHHYYASKDSRWNDNLDWRSSRSQTSFFLQNASFSLIQPIRPHIPGYASLTVIMEIARQMCWNKLCHFTNEPRVGLSWSRCMCPQVSFRQCKTLKSEIQFHLEFLDALASLKTMVKIK